MHLRKSGSKGVAVNKIPIKKASELFGILNIVFFSPEDLNIIKKPYAERRRFIDLELCQLDKLYLSDLSSFNKVLNQRNKLLKDISFRPLWILFRYGICSYWSMEQESSGNEKKICGGTE